MNGLKELKLNYKFKNFRVSEPSIAFFLSMQFFLNPDNKIVYFASDNSKLETIEQSLKSLNFGSKVSTFPSFDCNFFSNLSPTASNKSARIKTLYNLINNEKMILICSLESLVEKTVSKNELINKELILNKESNVSYNQIIEYLINNRYERVEFLNNVGEFAKRGEIIDIFSPSCNFPIRIFFNFEKIENLQEISIKSQETTNSVDFYKLIPASEIFLRRSYNEIH